MPIIYIPFEVSDDQLSELCLKAVRGEIPSGSIANESPAPRRTQAPEDAAPPADPWASDADPTGPTSSGSRGSSASTPDSRSSGEVKTVQTKFGVQTWRFPPDAPNCLCGQRSGLMSAVSSKGNRYSVYKCAKAAGDDWRAKCDFSEYPR